MTTLARLPLVDADRLSAAVGWVEAIDAIESALRSGTAPGRTPPRTAVGLSAGELLVMPAEVGEFVGTKLVTVTSPPVEDGPRIQGVFVLCDARTLSPLALFDGPALTELRTAAVSVAAARALLAARPRTLVVFGSGPQARAHALALVVDRGVEHVTVVGRDPGRARALARDLGTTTGVDAQAADPASGAVEDALAGADVIVCATTATAPLFDSDRLRPEATVLAIGSHSPKAREVDTALVRDGFVVVESRASAAREAGDVVLAVADGVPEAQAVDAELGELLVGGLTPPAGRRRVFKGVGEAWSDVVVAAAAYARL